MADNYIKSRVNVLGVGIAAMNMQEAVTTLVDARLAGQRGYVCVTGVHGVMESRRDAELMRIHNHSFLTVPDGMPTVWMGREYGFVKMGRVYGPDLMLEVCKHTSGIGRGALGVGEERGSGHSVLGSGADLTSAIQGSTLSNAPAIPNLQDPIPGTQHLKPNTASTTRPLTHFLYGATEETLSKLKSNLEKRFPGIRIVGTYAPPFRPLNEAEEEELREIVAVCKPDFFWVGLSTPKQEKFMAAHAPAAQKTEDGGRKSEDGSQQTEDGRRRLELASDVSLQSLVLCSPEYPLEAGILLGVGAAFDIHAGNYKDSPEWIKNSGFQWLHRLLREPRRLWRRYLWIVPGFLWLAFLQVMGLKRFALEDRGQRTEDRGPRTDD